MNEIIKFKTDFIKNYPEYEDEVIGLFDLCIMEIEEGGSIEHEFDLFQQACEQLFETT